MMDQITFHTRACSILGLLPSASEADVLARLKQLVKENESANILGERELKLREMETAMNCSREVAVHALNEQERELRLHPR